MSDDKRALFAAAVKERQPYYHKRIELFEKYHAREEAAIEAARAANVPIKVTLPDGATKDGIKGVTTPLDVATSISKSLAKKVLVAKVDGDVWDLFRPMEGDCSLSLHTFDDADGKEVGEDRRGAGRRASSSELCPAATATSAQCIAQRLLAPPLGIPQHPAVWGSPTGRCKQSLGHALGACCSCSWTGS